MIYTIRKHTSRAVPLRLRVYFKQYFRWGIRFDRTAKYDIGKDYQGDIQKLVGIRYFWTTDSARFGWRFNPERANGVEILAYVHDKDFVTKSDNEKLLGFLSFFESAVICLSVQEDAYVFTFRGTQTRVRKTHDRKISYAQGPYFESGEGANTVRAPHDIKITIL